MENVSIIYEINTEEPNPDSELARYAQEHIGEDSDTNVQIIEQLRDLIFESGQCSPPRLDDQYLLRFLRARNFVVRHAYRLLVNYCTFKEKHPHYFSNLDKQLLDLANETKVVNVQPLNDREGHRAIIFRCNLWDPTIINTDEFLQTILLVLELGVLEPISQIVGGICIFDVGGVGLHQLKYLTPKLAKLLLEIIVHNYPIRVQSMHFVNNSALFKTGFAILKTFMSKEVRNNTYLHSAENNYAELHEHVNPQYLPRYLGGVQPDYDWRTWLEYIFTKEDVLEQLVLRGYGNLIDQVRNATSKS